MDALHLLQHRSQNLSISLTGPGAVGPDWPPALLQPAAGHAGQVGGELAHRRQRDRADAVTVGGVTLTHHRVEAKVSGHTSGASWRKRKSKQHVFYWISEAQT